MLCVEPRVYRRFVRKFLELRAYLRVQVFRAWLFWQIVNGHEPAIDPRYLLEWTVLHLLCVSGGGPDLHQGVGYMRGFVPVIGIRSILA